MWTAGEVIVGSDSHSATERGRRLFQADEQLAGFLDHVVQESRRCHLLLNDDDFDFLVGQREEEAINPEGAAAHPELLGSLRLFANYEGRELILLGGKHDPEIDRGTLLQVVWLVSQPDVYRSSRGSRLVINRFKHVRAESPWLETSQPTTAFILSPSLERILPTLSPNKRAHLLDAGRPARSVRSGSPARVEGRQASPALRAVLCQRLKQKEDKP